MSEIKQRILDIIRKPHLACLATITDGDKPWVRYVMCFGREDMTIRCATFVNARKVAQIEKNPEVHLTCGIMSLTDMTPYLQIQGTARVVTDKAERDAFWNDTLKEIFKGPDDPNYGVIIITPYRIEYCTLGSYTPEVWES